MLFTPQPAKSFSINTNSRDLDYQVSTKAILQIIRNNPQGMTLTEIAKAVDPNWQTSNCKRMFKQAIDPLCLRDEVRFSEKSGKRYKYYPTHKIVISGNVNKSRVSTPLTGVRFRDLTLPNVNLTLIHDPVSFDT